jgi:hypothetical protein
MGTTLTDILIKSQKYNQIAGNKLLKDLVIPNFFTCGESNNNPKLYNNSNKCVDDEVMKRLIKLASIETASSNKHKRTRKSAANTKKSKMTKKVKK